MKINGTKIVKIFVRTLLVLMLFLAVATILIRNELVQTKLAKYATDYLAKELNTDVRIKRLSVDFARNIYVGQLLLRDKQKDTLFYIDGLSTKLISWDVNSRKLNFGYTGINNSNCKIGTHKGTKELNINFLLKYLNPKKVKKKKKTKSWAVYINNGKLFNCDFYYFDFNKKFEPKGILDQNHLKFSKLSGTLNDFWLIDDSLNFTSNALSAVEKSGLHIKSFNANCNIHNKGMDFNELNCDLNCSQLKGELHYSYPGYKYLDEFIHNTEWKAKLRNTNLCLTDLKIFSPYFNSNLVKTKVNAEITGTFDNLNIKNLKVKLGDKTEMEADLVMKGLPNWKKTTNQWNIRKLITSGPDISALLNSEAIPKQLFTMQKITYVGIYEGSFLNFNLNGKAQIPSGEVALGNVNLNLDKGTNNVAVNGFVKTTNFDLKPYTNNSGVNLISAQGIISLTGLGGDKLNSNFKGDIQNVVYKQNTYSNIKVDALFNGESLIGKIISNDPKLSLNFDGIVSTSAKSGKQKFKTIISGLELKPLGLQTLGDKISSIIEMDGEGFNVANFKGNINLKNVEILKNGKVFYFKQIQLTKVPNNMGGSKTNIKGDLGEAEILGNVDFADLGNVIKHNLHELFPNRFEEVFTSKSANFSFNLNITKPEYFESFISEKINTGPITASGLFNESKGIFSINTNPFNFRFKDISFENLQFDINKVNRNEVEYSASIGNLLKNGKPIVGSTVIAGTVEDGTSKFIAKVIDPKGKNSVYTDAQFKLYKDSIPLIVNNVKLNLEGNNWELFEPTPIIVKSNGVVLKDFFLQGAKNYFELNGVLGKSNSDSMYVDFGNIERNVLSPFLGNNKTFDSTNFRLSGRVNVKSAVGEPNITGDCYVKDFTYMQTNYGDIQAHFEETYGKKDIGLFITGQRGYFKGIRSTGVISPFVLNSPFDFNIVIPKTTPLQVLQTLFKGIVTINKGTIGGWAKISGNSVKQDLSGMIKVDNTNIKVDYLNTAFTFNGNFFINNEGLFTEDLIKITDEEKQGTANTEISLFFNKNNALYLDLRITDANKLKCLNTELKDNSLFYGKGYANGTCRIFGPFNAITMDMKLKTMDKSVIYLPYTAVEEQKKAGFITFKRKNTTTQTNALLEKSSIKEILIEIESTPTTDVFFVIDQKLGDVINGRGNGLLKMRYAPNEDFYLSGGFTIEQGLYSFSLPLINVLTRTITLNKGGQIVWSGNPLKAQINMEGSVQKSLSPKILLPPNSNSYLPITVISKLKLKGDLFKPDISFDIESPDLNSNSGGDNLLSSSFARIRADKDETMRQAVWLLVFGSLLPPSNLVSSASIVSSVNSLSVAGNSLSALASSQINNILNQFGLRTQFQLNLDDVGDNLSTNSRRQLTLASETKITENLTLGLNYDNLSTNNKLNSGINFNIEYTPNNNKWRMKVFSRNQNQLNSNIGNVQNSSGYSLGLGLIFQREFDSFKAKRKKKKK